MPLTKRDKVFYDYLVRTRLPIWSTDAAKMFYPSETGNERSSLTICQRRARVMQKEQYIEISKKSFGEGVYYYVGQPPGQKLLRHNRTKISTISKIATSGFQIMSVEPEFQIKEHGIQADLLLKCKYGKEIFLLLIEVDLTKDFNVEGYTKLIKAIQKGEFKTEHPLYILSVSDFKIKDEFIKKYVTQIMTDFKDFEKFKYNFIK